MIIVFSDILFLYSNKYIDIDIGKSMVLLLILDGESDIIAPMWSIIGYLICVMHSLRSKVGANL